jgi:hypothetical protein
LNRNLHFAPPAMRDYTPDCPARDHFAFVPRAKIRQSPPGPLPGPRSHDLPHFEALPRIPLRQLPSVFQIAFAWLQLLAAYLTTKELRACCTRLELRLALTLSLRPPLP